MYLQIPRGGYTIDDWFVAYSDNDHALFSAAAHEGWHQYAARHFKGRLPPFLEEGFACLFENVRMISGLPRWNLTVNPERARALARKRDRLWPLEQLIAMHAGDVVDQPQDRIDAFYAQTWAFARFLLEADGGRHRAGVQQWLADTACGGGRVGAKPWQAAETKGLIEYYLGHDLASLEQDFSAFVVQITREGDR